MKSAGYRDYTPPNAHPHRKRMYFYDPEGNDWEFVQYLSQDPAERNDYKLPESLSGVGCCLPWEKGEDKNNHVSRGPLLGEESDGVAIRSSWAEEACVSPGTR